MNKSEKFFDKASSRSNPEPNKVASVIIDTCKQYLNKDSIVLDFGCGSGAITNKLAVSVASIDALDISSDMLDFAKKQADERSINHVRYLQNSCNKRNHLKMEQLESSGVP